MIKSNHLNQLKNSFPFTPTSDQFLWFELISEFLNLATKDDIFILKGYAGTGKSTLISHLVNNLKIFDFKGVLLAPTGRAAKVISGYSKKSSFTIHKQIYFTKNQNEVGIKFSLKNNKFKNTIFIVDEASMISNSNNQSGLFENDSLLQDLIKYVYNGNSCFLVFVGDTAQLPPIGLQISPALDDHVLERKFNMKVSTLTLKSVVRQDLDSGILKNATTLRTFISNGIFNEFKFDIKTFDDIIKVNDGDELLTYLDTSLSDYGTDDVVFVVRSNKRANTYNQGIRRRILSLHSSLSTGDKLMVVKNNYFWLNSDSQADFIANGDIIVIEKINKIIEIYDLRFAEITARLTDYPQMLPFETVIILDTLSTNFPSMSQKETQAFYNLVKQDYESEKSNFKKYLKIKNNKFFNALQVKYSYCITCHKSQGGQWDNVFVEFPYLPEGPDKDFFRWLYTAITRARKRLYLVGFPKEYF
ncbi:MAG: ATP-dependent endonuclease [Flavobacteriaceae bacterium]|nr:ATP-dependent endonuclease [Flavobacteriaceae bacterium]|tara:strand:+ start:1276 stop:2694 length:1419 start_codon:yes stop_codon:yes gene_type:complete